MCCASTHAVQARPIGAIALVIGQLRPQPIEHRSKTARKDCKGSRSVDLHLRSHEAREPPAMKHSIRARDLQRHGVGSLGIATGPGTGCCGAQAQLAREKQNEADLPGNHAQLRYSYAARALTV